MADADDGADETYSVNAVHLMRTAQLAQLQLSAMADTKASILMGATFVIFTITIGRAQGASAPLPLLILGGAAFLSAIFAILAVLPATKAKQGGGKPNILFFGTFTRMSEEEFVADLTSRLKADHSLYETMARDVYQGGAILQRKKYRMLAWAYRILLVGLVASCGAYVWIYLV
ncbi:Pycsar system effector family protein [Sphingosinicella sp.]|uniref:Pycsar system effector family protein n=1 Tax=Sphingosinicella sp. TaxID=1917971 RepID=UPI0040376858